MASAMISQYPPGFGFYPKDDELIEHYLVKKVKGCYQDYGTVTDADVFELEPDHLVPLANYDPGDGNLYFFAPIQRKNSSGNVAKRSREGGGTWESSAKILKIKNQNKQWIGERRLLVYKIGAGEKKISTPWRIHEFRLAGDYKTLSSSARKGKGPQYVNLVLCRLFWSKREPGNNIAPEEEGDFHDGFCQQEQQQKQASCSYTLQPKPEPTPQGSSLSYGSSSQQSHHHDFEPPLQMQLPPLSNPIPLTTNGYYTTPSQQNTPETEDDINWLELEAIINN